MTSQPAQPTRPDEATLILAKEIADDVLSSPVITEAARFQMHIHLAPGEQNATFDQPERRVLRDFLSVLRNFDMPTSDVRMLRLFEIIERVGLKPEWRPAFERVKESYASLNERSWVPAPADDPDLASPARRVRPVDVWRPHPR